MKVDVVHRKGSTPQVRIVFPTYRNHTVVVYPHEKRVHVCMYARRGNQMKITQFIYNGDELCYNYTEYQSEKEIAHMKYIALLLMSGKQDIIDAIESALPLPIYESIVDYYDIGVGNIEQHMDKLIVEYGKLALQKGDVDVSSLTREWLGIEQKNSIIVSAEILRSKLHEIKKGD